MKVENRVVETRSVKEFDQVVLRDHFGGGELWISQGNAESLTIAASREILPRIRSDVIEGRLIIRVGGSWLERFNDMLITSFTRPRVIYRLVVKELRGLEIFGAVLIQASELRSDKLTIKSCCAGKIDFQSLQTESLEVVHDGAGEIIIEGQTTEQHIRLGGVASYDGSRLKSKNAHVDLRGTASVVIQVADELHVRVNGLGSVEYYGYPMIKKYIVGMGSVVPLGHI